MTKYHFCVLHAQVWLADWTGCAVAVKELMGFGSSPDDCKAWQEMQNEVGLSGHGTHAACSGARCSDASAVDGLRTFRNGWSLMGGCAAKVGQLPATLHDPILTGICHCILQVHMLGTYNHPNVIRFMAVCLVSFRGLDCFWHVHIGQEPCADGSLHGLPCASSSPATYRQEDNIPD